MPLTVDDDDEDVTDSRKAGRPLSSNSPPPCLPICFLVIGGRLTEGRLRVGLACLVLKVGFIDKGIEGE